MTERINDFQQLLFPVREVPVYAALNQSDEAARIRIPGRKAIVDCSTDRILSVVSENYQLVSNRDALNYAYRCCEAAFPDIPRTAWVVSTADAPSTGGHCHFDLTETTSRIDFNGMPAEMRPDTYGPFVRVTNSYNRTRALGVTIGFMRKVCSNGMILPKSSIHFFYNHNTRRIGERIQFQIENGAFQGLKTQFLAFLEPLRQCHIPLSLHTRIALDALHITEAESRPKPARRATGREGPRPRSESRAKRARSSWERINSSVERLSERYAWELGPNAYSLMNVVTDLATRPADVEVRRRERHSLQCIAGRWLAAFSTACKESDFEPGRYADQLRESARMDSREGSYS